MSQTTTSTADQPSHSLGNVLSHPGSSWAGAGIVATTIGTMISAGSMPTTTSGWVTFAVSILLAVAAALGK
jgi:hypothetical protein